MDTQDNKKETLEQFGARVREKYPEYLKYSNKEIAQKMVAKFPQYASKVSDLEEPKKPSFFGKVGRFFTSGTQKLGGTLGQIKASETVIPAIEESEKLASDTELKLRQQIRKAKTEGRDTTRLEKALIDISGRQKTPELIQEIVPGAMKSNRQVIGEIGETTLEALSGGGVSGISKVKPTAMAADLAKKQFLQKSLGGRLAQIGKETAKDLAVLAPFGYSFDVFQNLQQDKTGMEAFKPGVGTLVSTILPLGIGGVRATRQIVADTLSNVVAPNLSGVQSGAYKQMRTGNVDIANAKQADEVLNDARATATAFKKAMQDEFGEGQEKLITELTGKRVGLTDGEFAKLSKIAERFGFEDRLPQNVKNMSVKETMDLIKEINSVGMVKEFDDPLVKNLKLSLADLNKGLRAKSSQEFGEKFDSLYSNYARKSEVLKRIQDVIGKVGVTKNGIKLNPTKFQTATSRLQRVFQENGTEYLKAIKQLEDETGEMILDKVAASQLANILPKTLRTTPVGIGGTLTDAVALLTMPLSSPRFSSFLISQIGGYGRGTVTKLLNANPQIRKAIYDAVHKNNMKFSDAVELYAIDYIKNPKMGASILDVSKNQSKIPNIKAVTGKTTQTTNKIPKNISIDNNSTIKAVNTQGLIEEAKKYKSAEEFVKAQGSFKTPYDWNYLDEMQKAKDTGEGYSHSDYNYLSKLAEKYRGKEPSEPFFRAGSIEKSSLGEKLNDIYLTDNEGLAQQYANSGKTKVDEYRVLAKNPLEATDSEILKKILGDRYNELPNSQELKQKLIKYTKDKGYDSVRFPDSGPDGEGVAGNSLVVFDKNLIKTKSQLTDIWKKANNINK